MIRILIADDHLVVREGLQLILGMEEDLEVVGEAENGQTAVRLAAELQPDVVLMDLRMPGMDGLEAIEQVIQTAHAGIEDPSKPTGVFMLVGPSGVGKTESAIALADTLYGGERNGDAPAPVATA